MTLDYVVQPLTDYTGFKHADHTTRKGVVFRASWSATLDMLERELIHLEASDVVLELAVEPRYILQSGKLSRQTPKNLPHPGVRISFDTADHGRMSFTCDTYEARWSGQMPDWQANVRGIVLTLESLRAVGRHGATQGQEYAGFKALGAGSGAVAMGGMTKDRARDIFDEHYGSDEWQMIEGGRAQAYRRARARAHPDAATGSRAAWDEVEEAAKVLGVLR